MENARNTFYLALRNTLALVNPQRVTVVRGVERPGILVEENESATALAAPDIFVLRWTELVCHQQHSLALMEQQVELLYWTEGHSTNGGLDRGRLLSQMDSEVAQILGAGNAVKQNFGVVPPVNLATCIFWTGRSFAPMVTNKNRVSRVAKVTLYSYEEAADL